MARKLKPGPVLARRYEAAVRDGRTEDAEEAARLLQRHKRCRSCGAELTDGASVDRGVGPTCWARLGGAA